MRRFFGRSCSLRLTPWPRSEKRHAEAIARLAMALEDLAAEQEIAASRVRGEVSKAHRLINELVGEETSDRVFEEWERHEDAENVGEFERLKSLDVVADPKKREREIALEHKERARDRSALKVAGTEEAGA
jgi:hypothetical protein